MSRLLQIMKKELIQLRRDRRVFAMVFLMPIVQLFVFGYAVKMEVTDVKTVILDMDRTTASRDLIGRFSASGYFSIIKYVNSEREYVSMLNSGAATAAIVVENGFHKYLKGNKQGRVQVIIEGTNSVTASAVAAYADAIINSMGRDFMIERIDRVTGRMYMNGRVLPVKRELVGDSIRSWFNPNLESRVYYIPGVISMLLLLLSLTLTSQAIVREREAGTIEQLMVTPVKPVEIIVGKTLPSAAICMADAIIVTYVGVHWFRVPFLGSFYLFLACAVIYLLSGLGVGILMSTFCKTQQQAIMSTFFFFSPAILLSGFIFPIENMPKIVQIITYANPLRYFIEIVRGIFLKGVGIETLWPQLLALAIIGSAALLLSSLRFTKKIG